MRRWVFDRLKQFARLYDARKGIHTQYQSLCPRLWERLVYCVRLDTVPLLFSVFVRHTISANNLSCQLMSHAHRPPLYMSCTSL